MTSSSSPPRARRSASVGGSLKDVQPEELAKLVILAAVERAGVEPAAVDEVIIGQTKQSADAANLARVAALKAGFPVEVPAYTVMRQCGSGLQAVHNAVQAIRCGEAEIVVAGGVESMSLAPYYLRGARFGFTSGNTVVVDSNTESQPRSQPYEVYGDLTMGLTAENLAEKYDISREEQDAFALQSQERAFATPSRAAASRTRSCPSRCRCARARRRSSTPTSTRAGPASSSSPSCARSSRRAAASRPATRPAATTAAPASCSCRPTRPGRAASRRWPPSAARRSAAVDPRIMGIGPAPASRKALERAGLGLADIGLIEVNEAFAAQSLAVVEELGLDQEIVNVNGGAIALGHPLGCSGARILTTLLYEMRRRGTRYGLAGICIAGGQGMATIVEMAR